MQADPARSARRRLRKRPGSLPTTCPERCSIAVRAMPPERSSTGVVPRHATIVDSTPTEVGPPSRIMSMLPSRSALTCCAVVGETWPERFADGATIGLPNAASRSRATSMDRHPHGDGVETGGGEVRHRAIRHRRQHQRQRPGPERRREAPPPSHRSMPAARAAAVSSTCAISGLNDGRPFAA